MRCFVMINGGTGKSVMATAMMPLLKKKYDEVYVCSPYYDIFKCCSYVDEAFQPGMPNLYRDLLCDDDVDLLCREPYNNPHFIKKEIHLFEAWAEEWGIELEQDPMDMHPVLDKWDELQPVLTKYEELRAGWGKFILVQFCGGQSPLVPKEQAGQYNDHMEGIRRNYYKGQELLDLIRAEYPDHQIVHYSLPNEPTYPRTIKVELPYLVYAKACEDAEAVITIDSSLQHLAASKGAKTIVIWGETAPEEFGYNSSKNLRCKGIKNTQPYFQPLGASPARVPFPEPEEVMSALKEILPKE